MANRSPLVFGDDGLIEQLQSGDSLAIGNGLARLLIQNDAILKALARICFNVDDLTGTDTSDLTDDDITEILD